MKEEERVRDLLCKMNDDFDEMFLRMMKPDYPSMVMFFVIQLLMLVVFWTGFVLIWQSHKIGSSWQNLVIYAGVSYAAMYSTLQALQMLIGDIKRTREYYRLKAKREKKSTHFVDEGGAVATEV